ncbi:MAG TPA: DCC1-like thiol-disulfide oxidoreductase family protein [Gemmatimonadaceae bacterium]|nr:DCC1-like thiol-disulfide oxidoreductase family protein [Gemmatimonadaceae bacterium]
MIVYYDGVCALCNRFVRWALRNDPQGRLRFAALDSTHGEQLRQAYPATRDVDSIVVHDGERVYLRSDAIFRIWRELGGVWRIATLSRIVPRAMRDRMYDLIARRRYRWFGRFDVCPIPPSEVRDRFLS